MSTNVKTLESAALAAHRRGDTWGDFWQVHGTDVAQTEPWDRAAFRRLVARLSHLLTCGDCDGQRPLANPYCPWDEHEEELQAASVGQRRGELFPERYHGPLTSDRK
jgi:hypothetical protein